MPVWGRQQAFERQHLQRALTLLGLTSVLGAILIILAGTDPVRAVGATLVGLGVIVALAAMSRRRYETDARAGFAVLRSRDGTFVLGSAVAFLVVAALAAVLMLS
ncbi:hypothetical protein Q6348_10880 [Isoptericola sp. b441]|uniref:DUF202 domain-containing protein n=1 Tax=Actinotalea lenta TaxID=3064654 RepID=A0ABT9D9W7_9CELL|nr:MULTISPECIES: hypothetical protein [unclassified Isoptericola]MDO8107699.1 hypothetical protein [Isoptericola sp. b441]MDO8120630.1 hypothetical protein [Isoptericola sp. b490]